LKLWVSRVNPVTGGLEEVSPEGGYLLGLK